MTNWRDRLRQIIEERGFTMKQLSLAAGLGETAVRDMLLKVSSPRIDSITAVAEQLGLTLTELLEGEKSPRRYARLIGIVSAGEGWSLINGDGPIDEIPLDMAGGTPIALEVRGDSMTPVYRNSDLIIGGKRPPTSANELVGRDCIVETRQGARFVKFLKRGTKRGLYTLKSYNPAHEDIEDVELAWAAPITMVIRA